MTRDPLGTLRREREDLLDLLELVYRHFDDIADGAPDASYADKEAARLMVRLEPVLRKGGRIT